MSQPHISEQFCNHGLKCFKSSPNLITFLGKKKIKSVYLWNSILKILTNYLRVEVSVKKIITYILTYFLFVLNLYSHVFF